MKSPSISFEPLYQDGTFPKSSDQPGDRPANIIKWGDAVAYCNWLSEQEGLQPFYPKDADTLCGTIATRSRRERLPASTRSGMGICRTRVEQPLIGPSVSIQSYSSTMTGVYRIAMRSSRNTARDLRPLYRDQNITLLQTRRYASTN